MFTKAFSFPVGSGDVVSGILEAENNLLVDYSAYCKPIYIKNLLKRSRIIPRFRLFVCNPDGTRRYQIPNDDIASGGSYSENYQNGQRRTLSFTLINNTGKYTPGIDTIWINTVIALDIGIIAPEDGITFWFQKGIFIVNSANPTHTNKDCTVAVECSDKFSLLTGAMGRLVNTVEIPSGTLIEDVINDTLKNPTGNGYVFDSSPFIYNSAFKGRKTPLTVSGSSGSNWGDLLTQLADILSAEIFYNSEGRLTLIPTTEVISDRDKPVLFDFVDVLGDFQNDNMTFEMNEFINKVVVIGSNVNGHTVTAEAINDNPSSPLCYQKIGYRMKEPINDSNITNDFLAQERADYELRKASIAKTKLSSTVFLNPLLSVNNLVTFTDEFFSFRKERFLVQSISFNLDYNGIMSLTVSNINDLPYLT